MKTKLISQYLSPFVSKWMQVKSQKEQKTMINAVHVGLLGLTVSVAVQLLNQPPHVVIQAVVILVLDKKLAVWVRDFLWLSYHQDFTGKQKGGSENTKLSQKIPKCEHGQKIFNDIINFTASSS